MNLLRLRQTVFLALPLLLLSVPARGGDSVPVQVSASILSPSNCKFRTVGAALAFGNLFGGTSTDALATASINVRCQGGAAIATFAITDDSGQNELLPGGYRMRHATDPLAYLPYQLSYSPASASIPKGIDQPITFTGRVTASSINSSLSGAYADTVTLTLLP